MREHEAYKIIVFLWNLPLSSHHEVAENDGNNNIWSILQREKLCTLVNLILSNFGENWTLNKNSTTFSWIVVAIFFKKALGLYLQLAKSQNFQELPVEKRSIFLCMKPEAPAW